MIKEKHYTKTTFRGKKILIEGTEKDAEQFDKFMDRVIECWNNQYKQKVQTIAQK